MRISLIQALNQELENTILTRFNVDYLRGGRNPLGLAYIAAVLIRDGHEVEIIDRAALHFKNKFKRNEVDIETRRKLQAFQPAIIGISSLTGTFSDAQHIARLVRGLSGFKETMIVMGGFHPTVEDESVLNECPEVDLVLKGEAEYSFRDLVNGKKLEDIEGITLRKPGKDTKYYSNRIPKNNWNLDELPFPARHLLDMEYYTQPTSAAVSGIHVEPATFISSRGCPNKCHFCGAKEMNRLVRSHSAEYVIREIEHVVGRYNVSCIVFADQLFLTNNRRVEEFCNLMIDKKLHQQVSWVANSRVDYVNLQILKLMKEAGCIWVCYGFETGSQKILDEVNKRTSVEQNIEAALVTKKAGILVAATMIAGLPTEDENDFQESVRFLEKIDPASSGFNIFTLLPGTEYYKRYLNNGIIDRNNRDWRELGMINVSKKQSYSDISKEKLENLIRQANEKFSIATNYNYHKFNFLKNPQQSEIRYRYNESDAVFGTEECFSLYGKACELMEKNDTKSAIPFFQKSLDARPCLIPCPCPSGCDFYYDVKLGLASSFAEIGQFEPALAECDEVIRIPNLPYDLIDFNKIIEQCCESLETVSSESKYQKYFTRASYENSLFRRIPFFRVNLNEYKNMAMDILPITDWNFTGFALPNSAFEYHRVFIDTFCQKDLLLASSQNLSIGPGDHFIRYGIRVIDGGLKVSIFNKGGDEIAGYEHQVSSEGIIKFSLPKEEQISVKLVSSYDQENISTFMNIELTNVGIYSTQGLDKKKKSFFKTLFK